MTLTNTSKSERFTEGSEESFNQNVAYLQNTDFNEKGVFTKNIGDNTPMLILLQAHWCGHCKKMKPQFQAAANEIIENKEDIFMATIDFKENSLYNCYKEFFYENRFEQVPRFCQCCDQQRKQRRPGIDS